MKTGVIYTRVSSKKQDDNWTSPKEQEKYCREYCAQHNIKVVWVYKEVFSWKTENRPMLNEAIENAELNKVDFFIIYDIDRFSRQGYGIYSWLKQKLYDKWIVLKDYKNIIWDATTVIKNSLLDMWQYKWNTENPTEMSEMVHSAQAKIEWKKILQRTIGKEILIEQKGFHPRNSNYWYTLKKVDAGVLWKAKIQVEDPVEGKWVIEIFNEKAKGILSDDEIVKNVNLKGCLKRKNAKYPNDRPMDIDYMKDLIKNPIYAWIKAPKWNNYIPFKQQYAGLVSIETWNRANKGKKVIKEMSDGSIKIMCPKNNIEVGNITPQRRRKFNPILPYRGLILSSQMPWKLISWAVSRWNGWNYGYYHPIRKKKEKAENISKATFEKQVEDFFDNLEICKSFKEILEERFDKIFELNKDDLSIQKDILKKNLEEKRLERKKLETSIPSICSMPNMQRVLESINKQLDSLDVIETNIETQLQNIENSNILNSQTFKEFSFYIIEHLWKLLRQSQNLEELKVIFQFIFPKTPEYDEIVNRTAKVYPLFSLESQQKNPSEEEFSQNLKWQGLHC